MRESSRWCVMAAFSACGAARGAGHQCAACADRVRQVVGRLRACPIRRRCTSSSCPAQRGQGDRREGRARAGRRQGARGDVPSALSGDAAIRALLRGGRVQGRQACGLDPQPGRLSAACHRRQGARVCSRATSAASTPKAPAATVTTAPTTLLQTPPCWRAPSMGGRCGCNGCVTTSSSGSLTAPP